MTKRNKIVHAATESQPATLESDLYSTPIKTVSLIRQALGGSIDVDPFAGDSAFAVVNFRYPEQDGVKDSWGPPGIRAYVNPPFSGKWKALIHEKLMLEQRRGVTSILMVPSTIIGTKAGDLILRNSTAFCALKTRISFLLNGKPLLQPKNGSLLVLYSNRRQALLYFLEVLDKPDVGVVFRSVQQIKTAL